VGPSEPPEPFPFCEIIDCTEAGRRRCKQDAEYAYTKIISSGQIQIFTCHAGLTEVYLPIMPGRRYRGCISTMWGLLLQESSADGFAEIAQRVKDLGVGLDRLGEAYFQITPISREFFDVMIKLLNSIVEEIIRSAREAQEDKKRISELEDAILEKYNFDRIIGRSKSMQDIFRLLSRVIEGQSPILIEGETGTGKD
jgi:hypothetical protein